MREEELKIHDYLKVLKKRRFTIAALSLAVFLFVAAATFMAVPVYKATALIFIDPGVTTQYSFQQTQYPMDNPAYIQTQIGVLRSETIARKVVSKLGLDQAEEDKGSPRLFLAGMVGVFGVDPKPSLPGDRLEGAVHAFLKKIRAEAVKNSNLIKVSYEDKDPVFAAKVVNMTVQYFIEQNLEMKVAPAREAMSWLNDKLGEIKVRMTESSSQLQDFKQSRGLIVTGDKDSNISLQGLKELNDKALAAEAHRYGAEVKYQQVQKLKNDPEGLMTLPAVINSKVVQDLKALQSNLAKETAEGAKKFGEKHPQMIRLRNEKEALNRQIRNEVDLIVVSLKNDYEGALREEQSLKRALALMKGEAMSYERRSTEYDLMKQDVEGARAIYDTVLKKFQESNIMGNVSLSNAQLLDKAMPPDSPDRPRKALNLLLGMVLGLFTGVSFAFAFEYMDNTYKSPEDVEEHLGLPFLGMVPRVKELRNKDRSQDVRLVVTNPKSNFAESFRNIRSSLMLSTGDKIPKVIQVCSAIHSEGKSTVSLNLAYIIAAAGERVLLVDADMRKPSLHRAFKVQNSSGLSTLITRQSDLEGVIRETSMPNLSFISSGPISPNPGELLLSKTMAESMERLKGMFDRIIIDCPPYLGIADASVMTTLTDGVLLVARCENTARDLTFKAAKALAMIKARVLGVVLNDVSSKSESNYYYYYKYNYGHYADKKTLDASSK